MCGMIMMVPPATYNVNPWSTPATATGDMSQDMFDNWSGFDAGDAQVWAFDIAAAGVGVGVAAHGGVPVHHSVDQIIAASESGVYDEVASPSHHHHNHPHQAFHPYSTQEIDQGGYDYIDYAYPQQAINITATTTAPFPYQALQYSMMESNQQQLDQMQARRSISNESIDSTSSTNTATSSLVWPSSSFPRQSPRAYIS